MCDEFREEAGDGGEHFGFGELARLSGIGRGEGVSIGRRGGKGGDGRGVDLSGGTGDEVRGPDAVVEREEVAFGGGETTVGEPRPDEAFVEVVCGGGVWGRRRGGG